MSTHQGLTLFHVLGAILFIGNIIVSAWWKLMADRTKKPLIIQFAHQQIIHTDLAFTATGVVILAITGHLNASMHSLPMSVRWLSNGTMIFAASGLIWLFVLIPIQWAQARIVRRFTADSPVPTTYWKLARLWKVVGGLATALPIWTLYWMLAKPQ